MRTRRTSTAAKTIIRRKNSTPTPVALIMVIGLLSLSSTEEMMMHGAAVFSVKDDRRLRNSGVMMPTRAMR